MTPRVAYLVMSYLGPVERLVATLRAGSPDALVAVHHDPRVRPLGEVDALRIAPRPIAWGHGSQLLAVLHALRTIRDRADWFVLLSGQDYPVRPRPGDRGAASAAPTPSSRPRPSSRSRGAAARRTSSRAATGCAGGRRPRASRSSPRAPTRSPTSARCRAGPTSACGRSRRCRRFTARTGSRSPDRPSTPCSTPRSALLDHFLHTIVPTEAFVQTVLANSTPAAEPRQPPLRPLRPRLAQPAHADARGPRRRARLRRRLRAQVRRSGGARRARPAPNLIAANDGLDPLPDAQPARLPRGRAGLRRAAGRGPRRRDRDRRGRRRGRPDAAARRAPRGEVRRARPPARDQRRPQRRGRRLQRRARVLPRRRRRGLAGLARRAASRTEATTRSAARSDPGSRARACAPAAASRCR